MDANVMLTRSLLSIIFLLLFSSCAPLHQPLAGKAELGYVTADSSILPPQFSPLFLIENPTAPHNRIGTPVVTAVDGLHPTVTINPDRPTFFTEERTFSTSLQTYRNIIYRVHFREIPHSLLPFHLGAGKNVGLLVIVTLNSAGEPVLYTTVHTCGCYLAFIPTSFLSEKSLPDDWPLGRQSVYGENLPARLDFNSVSLHNIRMTILLRDGTHRIKDIRLADRDELDGNLIERAPTQALRQLEQLPTGDGRTISFYETSGSRKGFVLQSRKIWERIFMSWWALDWRVGEDKKLGAGKNDPPVFYTSLKPWAREESDLRDFATFLAYWGWRL